MWSLTPPVGTKAIFTAKQCRSFDKLANVEDYVLVNSGTAALALSLIIAKTTNPEKNEVILPAYGCPDLVAAIEYADLIPVIVDITALPYSYCNESLTKSVNKRTLAVICPTLLGIRMPLAYLRNRLGKNILIIEDNAQWLPSSNSRTEAPAKKPIELFDSSFENADMSIVSFGRGKPVNLLGGGALFLHNKALSDFFKQAIHYNINTVPSLVGDDEFTTSIKYQLNARLFNLLCTPIFYRLATKLPFLSVGKTAFHPLIKIEPMGDDQRLLLSSAVDRYLDFFPMAEHKLRRSLPQNKIAAQTNNRLLRYPLLCRSKSERDLLIKKLNRSGIGASPFYNALLTDIEGVDTKLKQYSTVSHAKVLSENMLTLPIHQGMSPACVDLMVMTIKNELQILESVT
ncbi:DegT/DnrJ/EryC1/StrS family aminotransferase [Alteromonas sp. S167]|uniref:DegT/DnrJ/EryC1/StrS family aminotransferase n=1 Tax=Alteromonas sp. S167 TaxID=3117402 RepID=UPI002FE071AC